MSALASIVVPCHDNLLYTVLCLDSIARHTPQAHEVIVVDNGCTDARPSGRRPTAPGWCAPA